MAQTKFVLGSGEVFTTGSDADAAKLRDVGVREATAPEVRHQDLKDKYSGNWTGLGEAASSALGGIAAAANGFNQMNPIGALASAGAVTALGAASPDAAKTTADYTEGVNAAHPWANKAGAVAGAVAGGAAWQAGNAAWRFATGAAQSGAATLDDLAMKHMQTPEGAEKIGLAVGINALIGGTLNVALGGMASWLGPEAGLAKTGHALQDTAADIAQSRAINPDSLSAGGFIKSAGQAVATAGKVAGAAKVMGMGAGVPGLGAAAAGLYAAGKTAQAVSDATPMLLRGAGKGLLAIDSAIVEPLSRHLGAAGVTAVGTGPAVSKLFGLQDYVTLAAGLQHNAETPAEATPAIAKRLMDVNLPGPVVDIAAEHLVKVNMFLGSQLPVNPWLGKTVAPAAWQPSLAAKGKFIEQANAVHDPIWALGNPTAVRMAAVRAVYPILAQNAANMVTEAAAGMPDMTLSQRRWAALLTGLDATPLDNLVSQGNLGNLDAQAVQPAAPGQRTPRPGSNIAATPTRMDRLSSH